MKCQTCGKSMGIQCSCSYWDVLNPIKKILVLGTGRSRDPWVKRDYMHYDAVVQFENDDIIGIDLNHRETNGEGVSPKPSNITLNNLRRNRWEKVLEAEHRGIWVFEPTLFTAKVVDSESRDKFYFEAVGVDGFDTDGRVSFTLSRDEGKQFLEKIEVEESNRSTPRTLKHSKNGDRGGFDWVTRSTRVPEEEREGIREDTEREARQNQ